MLEHVHDRACVHGVVQTAIRPTEHVRFMVSDELFPVFKGLLKRKNKFPVGGVMVTLLVPLAVGADARSLIPPCAGARNHSRP